MNYQQEVTANPFRLKMVGFEVPFHGRFWVPGDTPIAKQSKLRSPRNLMKVSPSLHMLLNDGQRRYAVSSTTSDRGQMDQKLHWRDSIRHGPTYPGEKLYPNLMSTVNPCNAKC